MSTLALAILAWCAGFPVVVVGGLLIAAKWFRRHPARERDLNRIPAVPPGRPARRFTLIYNQTPPATLHTSRRPTGGVDPSDGPAA